MLKRERRLPFVPYQEALDQFTQMRREVNDCVENRPQEFADLFAGIKEKALYGSPVAMDVLAYFYKSGIPKHLPENYNRYLAWEIVAGARGNELAIDKLQFLIGYACDAISDHAQFDDIIWKNDITEENAVHVLGKAVCKILVKDFLKAYPIDLVKEEDVFEPYNQEAYVAIRNMIDEAIPKTIAFLLS